jgi:hypothetical protein
MVTSHLLKVASTCLLLVCKMEEESRWIRDIFNLLHVLGFPSQEGGGRVGIKEEEEDNDSAMTNVEPKLGATGNGRRGQLVVTILKFQDHPPLTRGIGRTRRG